MSLHLRRSTAIVGVAALALAMVGPAGVASAAPDLPPTGSSTGTTYNPTIFTMVDPIYRVTRSDGNTLLTPWLSEATNAVENLGWDSYEIAFYASASEQANSEPVYRLFNPATSTFLHTNSTNEVNRAVAMGYRNEGVRFWVPAWDMRGTQKVHRLHKIVGGVWRYMDVLGVEQADAARAKGWTYDSVVYRAVGVLEDAPAPTPTPTPSPKPSPTPTPAPPPSPKPPSDNTPDAPPPPAPAPPSAPKSPGAGDGDGVFTFVQINDTQEDVWPDSRYRFDARSTWIVANEKQDDIRFVAHTGDIVNWWETATNNRQHRIAQQALAPIINSNIPFAAAIGNHDTLAVADGAGWDNRDENGRSLAYWGLRQTDLINSYFPSSSFRAMRGQMEPGKFDNSFHTFQAEGADFLVLSVELYPRQKAVDWAKTVLRDHPNHNVILLQHSWLGGWGGLMGTSEYGDLNPYQVQSQLVDPFPNVKMVLSGHVGETAHMVYTAPRGNTVLYAVTNLSRDRSGPVRTFQIDVDGDSVHSEIVETTTGTRNRDVFEAPIDWIE